MLLSPDNVICSLDDHQLLAFVGIASLSLANGIHCLTDCSGLGE